jgi:hypothetical protein
MSTAPSPEDPEYIRTDEVATVHHENGRVVVWCRHASPPVYLEMSVGGAEQLALSLIVAAQRERGKS